MIRLGFLMFVHADAHAEYQRRHEAIWPEMAAILAAHGVRSYSIHLDPGRSLLFAHVEAESRERWEAIADSPVCRRWWAYMRDIMETHPDGRPVSEPLAEVFHLEAPAQAEADVKRGDRSESRGG
jgi:L-rhamnose mutarotase